MKHSGLRKFGLLLGLGALALVAAAGSPAAARAQVPPRDQRDANLFYMSDRGQYLLVWVEDQGAGNRVMARRVRSNGLPIGGADGGAWEITGTTGTGALAGKKGDQRNPSAVEGLMVWAERAPGSADFDIYAQRLYTNFRANGRPKMIAGGPGNQLFPDVVRNGRNGEWLVVWSEDTTDAGDVKGLRLGQALTPRSKVFDVATGPGVAEDPTIARDLTDTDAFLVLFTDDRNGNKDIFGVRVTESGLPRGGPAAGPFEVVTSPEDDYAPQLVISEFTGSFNPPTRGRGTLPRTRNALLWTRDHVTDGPDVMGLRLNNNGLPQGGAFPVAAGPGEQSWPAGALRSPGAREEWLVIWQADSLGNFDIFGVDLGLNGRSRRHAWALASD